MTYPTKTLIQYIGIVCTAFFLIIAGTIAAWPETERVSLIDTGWKAAQQIDQIAVDSKVQNVLLAKLLIDSIGQDKYNSLVINSGLSLCHSCGRCYETKTDEK